jgi:Gpi18-like mannosyltransferase
MLLLMRMNDLKHTNKLVGWVNKVLGYIAKHELLLAIISVVIIISLGVCLGLQKNKVVPVNAWAPSHYLAEPGNHLSFLANLDGIGYISISQHGYSIGTAEYFPLYPILIHLVNQVIASPLYSSLIVSWTSLVGATYFYIKIIKKYFKLSDNIEALKGVLLFLLYPTGIFLIASYTEGLFAFLSLAAIYFALNKRYLLAGLFALLVTATHLNGLLTLLLVLLILYEEHVKIINICKTFILGIIGIAGYGLYLKHKFNNPIAFISEQKAVHGWFSHTILPELTHINPIEYIFVALIIVTFFYWWPKRKSFAIYSLLYLLIPIIGGTFGGFTRYTLMVFPLQFMIFDVMRKKSLGYTLALAVFAIGWTYLAMQFAGGYIG